MKQFIIALVIVIIAAAGYFWWQGNAGAPEGSLESDVEGMMEEESNPLAEAPMSATIIYNGSSFSPSSAIIRRGGTVTWTSTGSDMWVASAMHPTHSAYSGTTLQEHCAPGAAPSFDQCSPGTSYSFTFDKTGTWGFHDHINASAFGSVVVVE